MDIERWALTEVQTRWAAIEPGEREAFLRYGRGDAPWESAPDYAARILKVDWHISLDNAAKLAAIFRAAYDALVAEGEE